MTVPGQEKHATLSAGRILSLDGIRGLAVLSVVAFHTLRVKGDAPGLLGLWRAIQESSWVGVDLFFVLSGFLITGILLDSKDQGGYFKNFYSRRTLRIMPLYYAVLVVALIIVPAVIGVSRMPPLFSELLQNQIWLWTYLQNYLQARGPHALPGLGHFWSLAVEEQFYWFWPLVVYLLSRRNLFRLCVALCILEPLLRIALLHYGVSPWALRQLTHTRLDTLLYGAMAALLLREANLVRHRFLFYALPVLSVAFLLIVACRVGFLPFEGKESVIFGYSALGLLFATGVYQAACTRGRFYSLLSTRFLRRFGTYSYAIYIFHWPVAQAYEAVTLQRLAFLPRPVAALCCFAVVLCLSSGLAVASWFLFESRFIGLKKYFEYPRSASDAAVSTIPGELRVA
jgi:peptidoglycan/LPS O-acetylase OafA/YrhL